MTICNIHTGSELKNQYKIIIFIISGFQENISKHVKKQRMIPIQRKTRETVPEEINTLDLEEKDFKFSVQIDSNN